MIFTNTNTAFNGVEYKEIPCITDEGAPTETTEGAVGCLYMNTDNGDVYKCIAVNNGVHTYVKVVDEVYINNVVGDIETALDGIIATQNSLIGGGSV